MDVTPPNDDREQEEPMGHSREITTFDLAQYGMVGTLRTLADDPNDIWFVAKDVCDQLGLKNVSQALSDLDADQKGTISISDSAGGRSLLIISESGLYDLIFSTRTNPKTKPFKSLVTRKILPQIRKTGTYSTGQTSDTITNRSIQALRDEQRKKREEFKQEVADEFNRQEDEFDAKLQAAKAELKKNIHDEIADAIAKAKASEPESSKRTYASSGSPKGYLTVWQWERALKVSDLGKGRNGVLGEFLTLTGNDDPDKGQVTVLKFQGQPNAYRVDHLDRFNRHAIDFDGTWKERNEVFFEKFGNKVPQYILDEYRKSKDRQRQYGFKFADAHV